MSCDKRDEKQTDEVSSSFQPQVDKKSQIRLGKKNMYQAFKDFQLVKAYTFSTW